MTQDTLTDGVRDCRSTLLRLQEDAVKYDWDVEIPTPSYRPPGVEDEMLALLRNSGAPYKSQLDCGRHGSPAKRRR